MTLWLMIAVAGLGGFISLSYEILWFRVYSFASGGSPSAFGLLLGFYLAGIAIGAYLSRTVCQGASEVDLRRDLTVLSAIVFFANLAGYLVVPALGWLIVHFSWPSLLLLVTVSAGLFGAMLPVISHIGIAPDAQAGARLSYVYLSNILGSAAGSFLTGFVLTNVWPLRRVALFLAVSGLAVTIAVLSLARIKRGPFATSLIAIGIAGVLFAGGNARLFDRLYEKLLFKNEDSGERFADLIENRQGVIAVRQSRQVYGGGAYDGAVSTDLIDDRNLVIRAYAVPALHPRPRNILMIGLSTGAWAQIVANSRDVDHLTVVEINPGYLKLIVKYSQVASLLSNPKVEIVIDDGRRWLVQHPNRRFDVIVQNTTEHWRANVTNLLSREYLNLVREHLAAGGIFHYNTTSSQDAFKTAFSVFPYGFRFVNFATVSDQPVRIDPDRWRSILLGYAIDGRQVLDTTRTEVHRRVDSLIAFPSTIDEPPQFIGLEGRERLLSRLSSASVITDDNMLSEWRALVVPR